MEDKGGKADMVFFFFFKWQRPLIGGRETVRSPGQLPAPGVVLRGKKKREIFRTIKVLIIERRSQIL